MESVQQCAGMTLLPRRSGTQAFECPLWHALSTCAIPPTYVSTAELDPVRDEGIDDRPSCW